MKSKRRNNSQNRRNSLSEKGSTITGLSGKVMDNKYGYEIRLKNHLNKQWANWFDGWTINNIGNEEAILTCSETDHAGLHGVLDKIRDLNLTLISVQQIGGGE
jgi:hypothetical protein